MSWFPTLGKKTISSRKTRLRAVLSLRGAKKRTFIRTNCSENKGRFLAVGRGIIDRMGVPKCFCQTWTGPGLESGVQRQKTRFRENQSCGRARTYCLALQIHPKKLKEKGKRPKVHTGAGTQNNVRSKQNKNARGRKQGQSM